MSAETVEPRRRGRPRKDYSDAMPRVPVRLPADAIAYIDAAVSERGRGKFIREAVLARIERERRAAARASRTSPKDRAS